VFNAKYTTTQQNHYEPDFSLNNASLTMECGFGQGVTTIPLEKMGLEVDVLNTERLKNPDAKSGEHAFIVAHVPITQDGNITEKEFLIDVTYRQFFDKEDIFAPAHVADQFTTDSQQKFANTLMHEGWIELTEEHAQIYAQGFNAGNNIAIGGQSHIDVFHDAPKDVLEINEKRLSKGDYFLGTPNELDQLTLETV
jgi:hypothetical protein